MFFDNRKHKSLAFPAGEGADQLLRREADEGYASTASSVRPQPYKLQFEHFKKSIRARIFKDLTIRRRMLPFLPGGSYFVGDIIA